MNYEREVKVLDIDVESTISKLQEIGAIFVGKKEQKIYVYDIPTLYYRYLEICELLKSSNKLMVTTNIGKLKVLLDEFADLVPDEELVVLTKELKVSDIRDIAKLPVEDAISKIESKIFAEMISSYKVNPNKWIRLRKSNDKIELTTKHVFEKSTQEVQTVKEREVNTSSFEETNSILESIGIVKRSYQEKIRYSFKLDGADIEIDFWPMLNPYMEIECDDIDVIRSIITRLGFDQKEVVSTNTQQLYRKIGINLQETPELKFSLNG